MGFPRLALLPAWSNATIVGWHVEFVEWQGASVRESAHRSCRFQTLGCCPRGNLLHNVVSMSVKCLLGDGSGGGGGGQTTGANPRNPPHR